MMMRFLVLLALFLPFSGHGQSPDQAQIICRYEFKQVRDSLQPGRVSTDLMILKVGNNVSDFYSYNTFRVDSLLGADVSRGATAMEILGNRAKYGKRGAEYHLFTNYPQGKVTVTDKVVNDVFRYVEPLQSPKWTILAETSTLLNFKVQKAECTYAGRKYEAWFTTEIPVNRGPWKLHGLPGLIVKVTDSQQYFSFTLAGVKIPEKDKDIALNNTITYLDTEKGKFLALYKRYMQNPLEYINTSTAIRLTSKSPSSTLGKARAYNPIER